jgi:hypothetical protein
MTFACAIPAEGAPSFRIRSGQALAFFARVGGGAKFLRLASIGLDLLQGFQNLVGLSHIHQRNVHDNCGNHEQAPNSSECVVLH